jgi:hypothetical protein
MFATGVAVGVLVLVGTGVLVGGGVLVGVGAGVFVGAGVGVAVGAAHPGTSFVIACEPTPKLTVPVTAHIVTEVQAASAEEVTEASPQTT